MRPSTGWRTSWRGRLAGILAIGPSRLALLVAILSVLLSLFLPFWTLSEQTGSRQEIHSFSWFGFTTDRFDGGSWSFTMVGPYRFPAFPYPTVAMVAGNVYLLEVVYLLILVAILGLFQVGFSRTLPTLSLLFLSLIVLTGALFALFYPLVAIPTAATTDRGTFTVGSFWGTLLVGGTQWSWGPGLGWWTLLVGVILGILGAVLPYLKSVRAMATSTTVGAPPGP